MIKEIKKAFSSKIKFIKTWLGMLKNCRGIASKIEEDLRDKYGVKKDE